MRLPHPDRIDRVAKKNQPLWELLGMDKDEFLKLRERAWDELEQKLKEILGDREFVSNYRLIYAIMDYLGMEKTLENYFRTSAVIFGFLPAYAEVVVNKAVARALSSILVDGGEWA